MTSETDNKHLHRRGEAGTTGWLLLSPHCLAVACAPQLLGAARDRGGGGGGGGLGAVESDATSGTSAVANRANGAGAACTVCTVQYTAANLQRVMDETAAVEGHQKRGRAFAAFPVTSSRKRTHCLFSGKCNNYEIF